MWFGRHTAWIACRSASFNAGRHLEWDAAYAATWSVTRETAWSAAWSAARDAISALVAYDDCDHFLSMTYEKLRVWAILSEDHRAVLLLPMVYVKEKLANLTLQPA